MPFVKVSKNKQYFQGFQTKFRRRREGKTDYRQRHKLIAQDKNKYKSPKYRLVVRFSNRYVLCQIIYSESNGDKVLCSAHSKELVAHGLPAGLKNYAAAYCTGLLLARRLLKQLGLGEIYNGVEEPKGDVSKVEDDKGRTFYVEELNDEKRPFRAYLDVGIKNTTTGARVFGALKGASDGGLDIPHNHKRFPGYSKDTKTFDAEGHVGRITGEHVSGYMKDMQDDDEEKYKSHFSKYIEAGVEGDDLEETIAKVHASIRNNPDRATKAVFVPDKSYRRPGKKSYEERVADIKSKKAGLRANAIASDDMAMDEDDMDEDDA
jgi:large subunit ribosomal protein L5e